MIFIEIKKGDFVFMPCIEFYNGQKDVKWEVNEVFVEDNAYLMWIDSGKGILTMEYATHEKLMLLTTGRKWNVRNDS